MGKKEFATTAFDLEHEKYIVHVGLVSSNALPISSPLNVHPSRRSQRSGLIAKKAPTKIPAKYLDFADIFSLDLTPKLSKNTKINDHAIKLVDGQQLPYEPI